MSINSQKYKLIESNFTDWYRNLRIILRQEKRLYILEGLLSFKPSTDATNEQKDIFSKYLDDFMKVQCLMLTFWVVDIGYDFYICFDIQELWQSRLLIKWEIELHVKNEARVVVLFIRIYYLKLPIRLDLKLINCYYILFVFRILVFMSVLDKKIIVFSIVIGIITTI